MSERPWSGKTGIARMSVIIAIVAAGLIAVVALPRLRAFYFGQGAGSYERARATLPRLPTQLSAATTGSTGGPPGRTPLEVELGLERVVPAEYRVDAHHWLILHGRYVCVARTPKCWQCGVARQCGFRPKTPAPGR